MRALAFTAALACVASPAAAQEVQITGPLAGAPAMPRRRNDRLFAAETHLTGGPAVLGVGGALRVRPLRALGFEAMAEWIGDGFHRERVEAPLIGRILALRDFGDRPYDFFLGFGLTAHERRLDDGRWTSARGAELAFGVESFASKWIVLRAEMAAWAVDDRTQRNQALVFRLGVLTPFGARIDG